MVGIDLSGKCAVVTGASSGIGRATAIVLAACGAHVIATARDQARLEETAERIRSSNGHVDTIVADLEQARAIDVIREQTDAFTAEIDALLLPAGHFARSAFAETTVAELDRLWAVHARAPFLLTQALMPRLRAGSAVLFYSSTVTQVGFAPYAGYSAVKGAVEAFARALAVELAPQVRVNILAPGFTKTPMVTDQYEEVPELEAAITARTPVGFLGGPGTIAHLAAFLCSDLGSYIDGARLVVDGGWTAQGWQQG
jgi:NAD(P)-dependent dehydrogenase (short-subunit alcohol dehydrogenase family)